MVALVRDAELPPKIGVHPRPPGSFAHAMPALLRPVGDAQTVADDLLGIKWVTGSPDNRAAGLPAIHAVVIVSDPETGVPRAILDGGPITAERTAAVSAVAISRFAPAGARRATIIGAGVQGRSHLEALGHVLPGVEIAVYDRHLDRRRVDRRGGPDHPGHRGSRGRRRCPDRRGRGGRRHHRGLVHHARTPWRAHRGVADARCFRGGRRLRDDGRPKRRPRCRPVPRRRCRPVRREPGCGSVRWLSGSGRRRSGRRSFRESFGRPAVGCS